jgi:hypothetical protein
MHLYRHPFRPALDADELAESLDREGTVHEHRP